MQPNAVEVLCQPEPGSGWERITFENVVYSYCEDGALVLIGPVIESRENKRMIAPGCWRESRTVEAV